MKLTILNTFITICLIALSNCQNQSPPIVVATYAYAENNRIANIAPLAENLGSAIGRKVEVRSYTDVASFVESIKNGAVDIAIINTLGYLLLSDDDHIMKPIATLDIHEDAIDNYTTSLLVRANNGIGTIDDIFGTAGQLRLMFVAPGSTSGNLVPRLMLSSLGLASPEEQFKEVLYGGNHQLSIQKLIKGEADICFVGSNAYNKYINENPELTSEIKLLWVSSEIPLGPLMVKNELLDTYSGRLLDALKNYHLSSPEGFEAFKAGWTEASNSSRFLPAGDDYYDSFRMMDGRQTDLARILSDFNPK